jgi:PTH1 family peptidyl-tRNA hydrolase
VPGYVLHNFAKSDQDWVEDVLTGISDGAPHLAGGDDGKFMNAVGLRTAPQRSTASAKPKPVAEPGISPKPAAEPEQKDDRSALQKLVDKFR